MTLRQRLRAAPYALRLVRRVDGEAVIVYRRGDLAVFLLGFAKSERANIDDDELDVLRGQARAFLRLSTDQIEAAIATDELTEVSYGDEEQD